MAFPLAPPCGNTTFKKCLTSYWAFEFYFFVFTEQFVPSIVIARFLFFRQKMTQCHASSLKETYLCLISQKKKECHNNYALIS